MTRVLTPGLAPTGTLAPSATLAPADTIYAGAPISPHQMWMAVGTSDALVDVSGWVEFGEGITYTAGRQTQFDDATPGVFTFSLDNSDGRFTPDNPTSPLATKVSEGMLVKWLLGTRIVLGRVLAVEIPPDEAAWDRIVITCDDMLGTAARHSVATNADGLLARAIPKALWKLDEPEESTVGAETFGDGLGPFTLHTSNPSSTTSTVTFGIPQTAGLPGTAVTLTTGPGETAWYGTRFGNTNPVSYISNPDGVPGNTVDCGWWNIWVYPGSTCNLAVTPFFANGAGYSYSMQIQCTPTTVAVKAGTNTATVVGLSAAEQLVPHYYSMNTRLIWQPGTSTWALWCDLYIDGFYRGHAYWYDPVNGIIVPGTAGSMSPVQVNVSVTGTSAPASGTFQRVSYNSPGTLSGLEFWAVKPTLDARRTMVDYIGEDINTAVWNGPLTTGPVGFPDSGDVSLLDLLNEVARTESGHLFAKTEGTVASSTTYIRVRARDRPDTPAEVFDAKAELDGPPTFVRDLTNVARSVDVAGPTNTVTVMDETITGRYITAGVSETVLYSDDEDLREWGQDRLFRGKNRNVRAQSFTVDAASLPVDRSADLLALLPGDRVQLTNLPTARLGFGTWDGWLLGVSEVHSPTRNAFTFTLAPTTPAQAVYDTGRLANDGAIRVTNTTTATTTTLTVASDTAATLSTDVPYDMTFGTAGEQIRVTDVSGSTVTVVRGVNGTTAIAHSTAAPLEVVPVPLYAY